MLEADSQERLAVWSISNAYFFVHKGWKLRLRSRQNITVQILNKLYIDHSVSRGNNGRYVQILTTYKLIVPVERNIVVM